MKPCPVCGGVLETVQDALVGRLMLPATFVLGRSTTYVELQARVVIACTECEYAKEIR